MPDTVSDYFDNRGSLGVLILLKSEPKRFTDIADALHISTSTLTHRLGEARDLGFVVPEIEEKQTSVNDLYRLTERGQFVVSKLERLDVVHAYKTLLDAHDTIETGRSELIEWVKDEDVQEELARQSETDPYVDPFGHDVTDPDEDRRYR